MLAITVATPDDIDSLAEILHATVHAGASVSFILPFSIDDARQYWHNMQQQKGRTVLVARRNGIVQGTVQLILDTPPNQPHRAEIAKLLVHPNARRQGIARALMLAMEERATAAGRTLLTLDTRTGDSAEVLYLSLGYTIAGVIPKYARGPATGTLESTTILYKELPA